MWRISLQQLVMAVSCFAIALGAIRIETHEPYGILIASLAGSLGVMALIDLRWIRSERKLVALQVGLMLSMMIILGLVFAALNR